MGMREEVQFFFFLPVTLNLGLGCTLQMQINEGMLEHSHDARCDGLLSVLWDRHVAELRMEEHTTVCLSMSKQKLHNSLVTGKKGYFVWL